MAGMCCGVVGETETSATVESSSRSARRRRMEIHQLKFVAAAADMAVLLPENGRKRQKVDGILPVLPPREIEGGADKIQLVESGGSEAKPLIECAPSSSCVRTGSEVVDECPKFGTTSVCGRRRDMEDAVAVHPSFSRPENTDTSGGVHFFGVYDGHGCSHVAMKCKDRMHEIVKSEMESGQAEDSWKDAMTKSFSRMDKEVTEWSNSAGLPSSNCRCELQTPQCDAVGSTAVVAVVTPDKIVVSNCGDSRAVLCRKGVAIPLSTDHKASLATYSFLFLIQLQPDRPDELLRIEDAGGRVIYWDGARVLGVLAMSRAIGDNYLKPYVIPVPEVTVTERAAEDECLILASDGLWDVVSNDTACNVARMCLRAQRPHSPPRSPGSDVTGVTATDKSADKACSDASILLTKLALARHSTDNVSVVVVDLKRDL
ncbi:hypothetical protein RJ639_036715 [Escallonia herrerae]|uniref:protein-serine/threonine phosphatase n=1 Tax=Escallonia herrerae TaxID=1293975 RepID=A0AA89B6W8_9ASTE|nr:hypothetical protein RJ639_036715 [Escallonia herrerae]